MNGILHGAGPTDLGLSDHTDTALSKQLLLLLFHILKKTKTQKTKKKTQNKKKNPPKLDKKGCPRLKYTLLFSQISKKITLSCMRY